MKISIRLKRSMILLTILMATFLAFRNFYPMSADRALPPSDPSRSVLKPVRHHDIATYDSGLEDATQIAAWEDVVLTRPLFNPTRRPDAAPGATTPTLRLTGIVLSNGQKKAIFMSQEGGQGVVVEIGSTIGEWRIVAIEQNTVKISGTGGERLMKPDRIRASENPMPKDNSESDQDNTVLSTAPSTSRPQ
ncbi:hypothetical protein AA101099_0729 [Neoasaia chiangmaiensis NBRC 101099]|nr:hypothetical protein AA101099_0729 [Neoasaia chiangmaiensis NBRC 101099]